MKNRSRFPLIAALMARLRWRSRGLSLQQQSGGGNGNEPPRRPNQGPPDLDELWRDFNRKLGQVFGGRGGNRNGGGGLPNLPQPGMKGAGIGVGLIVALIVAVWLGSGFFTVQPDEQAVITTFGKPADTPVGAGLNWRWPRPIQDHETVLFSHLQSVEIGRDNVIAATGLPESAMLTQDKNIVEVKFAVQYRLKDAIDYLYQTDNPEDAVRKAAESAVREVVGQMTMDSAMGEGRDQIATRVRDLMQKILDRYKTGVQVSAVNMQKGGVLPPDQVKDAFNDIQKAGQDRERARNEAQAYFNQVVPLAVGKAARAKQEADGYKASVVARAQGDAQRFLSVLAEYQKAPQVTRDRMYLDAMRDVYASTGKVIVDSKAGSLMYLPLDKVLQAARPPAPAASAQAGLNAPPSGAAVTGAGALPTDSGLAGDARSRDDARSRNRGGR